MISDPVERAKRWIEEEQERKVLREDNKKLIEEVMEIKNACERVLEIYNGNTYEIVPDSEPLTPRRYRRKVLCNGKVYVSIKECAKHLGVSYTTLRMYISGEREFPKHMKGMDIRYFD